MTKRPLARLALAGTLGLALVGGVVPAATIAAQEPAAGSEAGGVMTTNTADVVERVAPAVVTVINEQQMEEGLFDQIPGADQLPGQGEEPLPAGSGTGFIIDQEGHVVTNEHVVRDGEEFVVLLADGEERSAELVGADPRSDLAVVRIEGAVPATVALGDSDALRVGEPVLAVGSPLGALTNTVTQGIVSALGRTIPPEVSGEAIYASLIQHDAAINPGNSGGPLFNAAGDVVGVNTLGVPFAQGIYFAVPASTVEEVVTQLIETGEVIYPFFGITSTSLTDQIVAEKDLAVDDGALVLGPEDSPDVQPPSGPAAEAGIEVGDVIVALDGQSVDGQNPLVERLFDYDPGDTVTATVQRGDEQLEIEVTLGERPEGD